MNTFRVFMLGMVMFVGLAMVHQAKQVSDRVDAKRAEHASWLESL